jgi:hypothetical protein
LATELTDFSVKAEDFRIGRFEVAFWEFVYVAVEESSDYVLVFS